LDKSEEHDSVHVPAWRSASTSLATSRNGSSADVRSTIFSARGSRATSENGFTPA
uniref:Ankyrin repeat protein n=1 Tax=Gongylonema pulchrum TaxID=637853 RepID=A0A183EXP2_9BILA